MNSNNDNTKKKYVKIRKKMPLGRKFMTNDKNKIKYTNWKKYKMSGV